MSANGRVAYADVTFTEAAMAATHACLAQWEEVAIHIRGALRQGGGLLARGVHVTREPLDGHGVTTKACESPYSTRATDDARSSRTTGSDE